ncbi:MAG: alpha-2-macroglobulin [Treponema sp.]|jgi:uncharacterized protein YfaS (alpha-2-macroglobulin family)|nr:alpha-2-macroglobulin [Treponema sp.]
MSHQKRDFKSWLHFFLGFYTPPEFVLIILKFFTGGRFKELLRPLSSKSDQIKAAYKTHRVRFFVIMGTIYAVILFFIGFFFFESRKPQPIFIDFFVSAPTNEPDPDDRKPLIVEFEGSAAPLEMADKEISGGITINPPMPGIWRWIGDDTLVFTAENAWKIGSRYTVNLGKNLFPRHIRTNNSFAFNIEDFSLVEGDTEFYIDPEDSAVKRVTAGIKANYPIDSASLENSIRIEPQISADSGSLQKRLYQYTVNYSEDRTEAYIVSEALGMPSRSVPMKITVQKGVKDATGNGSPGSELSFTVEIPGMANYASVQDLSQELVRNAEEKYDQVIVLSTKGTIDEQELAKNIGVWELPVDLPELPGLKAVKNYDWYSADRVVDEVLALSRKIDLDVIPGELKYNSVNSFKFTTDPGRYVYIKLNRGTKFYGGYYLSEPYETVFQVKRFPRELTILSEGAILSFSGDKRLPMMTRGISEVSFNIGRIRPDDINHLVSQTSGDISNLYFRNYTFNYNNITEQYTEKTNIILKDERDIGYFSFDFARYLANIPAQNLRHGFFIFTVQGEGSNEDFQDRRLIMITDLGFYVKTNADNTKEIFVQSIATGRPVAGATVNVLGLNGNPIVSTYTGIDGHAQIPELSDFKNNLAPTVYTVRLGEDMSFMPYFASGRNLDYSSFDIGGIQGADDPKTLRAFIFSDRGIYRPGDEIRIGLAVKAGDWKLNLARTPLEFLVTDPRGAEIFNKRISLSPEGMEEIRFSTQNWSPTGAYTGTLYVIRERENRNEERIYLGSETIKVEEFLPDSLNVTAVLNAHQGGIPQTGWIAPGSLEATVTVRNLFGTAAAGNDVKAQINLTPGRQYFRQYQDYQFQDPYQTKNSFQEFLGTITTNDEGTAVFPLNLAKFEKATFSLSFYAEAFEKGSGRNVSARTQVYVSPLPHLIGFKADGNLNYVQHNTTRLLSFIAVNPQLEKISVDDITFNLTELRYVSVLVKQPNGTYKYQSVQKEYPVSSEKAGIPAEGYSYRLPTDTSGEFRLTLTGSDGLEYNNIVFTVAGTGNLARSLNRTAELELTLNKSDFSAGETIQLMIKAPYQGAGLITIERDKVYAYKWFQGTGETTMQSITVPAELEGNGYVNVQFTRAQDSPEIFMSPFSYGTLPISISKENRTNRISLDISSDTKPGRPFSIKYSTNKPGKIIIYAVDEGILQLAQYRTPDPIDFFFKKRALEVRTAGIMDLILPRFSIVQSMGAMGGGEGFDEIAGNLNPFKRKQNAPVAFWSGIINADSVQREIFYTPPDYFNGTLRVMAVSISDDAVGSAEERSLVRSTFIISPNTPMMAAPGDEFAISLTVTNNQKGVGDAGKVRLTAEASPHISISGGSFDMAIPEGKSHTLNIPVKAAGPLGAAEIKFIASDAHDTSPNAERSELSAYLSIRPAVPYRVSLSSGALKNKSAEIPVERQLYEEFHTREVSLSYLPTGMAKGLYFYLDNFPYGCSEQLISAAFPFLYPQLFFEFGFTRQETEEGIYRIIGILQARLKEDGSVGMWTAQSYSSPLITVYAAHFLTEARNAGYYVPATFMQAVLEGVQAIVQDDKNSWDSLSARAYAIYILTLNEIVTTPLVESLKRDINRYRREAETELPGLYLAGTYALLKKNSDASALLGRIKRTMTKDASYRYTDELMYNAVYLSIIAQHFPNRLRDISEDLLQGIAGQLEHQAYTTISANYALMAINAYLKVAPTAKTGNFTVLEMFKDNQRRPLTLEGTTLFSAPFSAEAQKISIENKDQSNLFYQINTAGFDRELPSAEIKNGIEVFREYLDGSGKVIDSAQIGDIVRVKLNVRSLGAQINDVALVDLLPAGLEADIPSVREAAGGGAGGNSWRPDYVDIREDRIVLYGTAGRQISTFTYQARAINAGSFTSPPLFAEAMYDKSIWALRPQTQLIIVKSD